MTEPTSAGSCERTRLLLCLHADRAVTPSQQAEIDAHLPGCGPCRRVVRADAAVRQRLAERAGAPAPSWLAEFAGRTARLAIAEAREARAQNRLLWMSAAAALVLAVTARFVVPERGAAPGDSPATASVRESTRLALIRPLRSQRGGEGK